MTNEIVDLRGAERFVATELIAATFASCEASLLDIALYGLRISHGEPLRIGTRARFVATKGDARLDIPAQVVWSHLGNSGGKLVYTSGLRIETPEPRYAAAINALFKSGALRRDPESLERKRQRMLEREAERAKTTKRNIPSSGSIAS